MITDRNRRFPEDVEKIDGPLPQVYAVQQSHFRKL